MHGKADGFTLLEVLISITLVAVIVVILSMAFRSGVRAYVRGREMNRKLLVISSVEGLFDRQLRTILRFQNSELGHYAWFEGKKNEISFVTTTGPMSSQTGGMLLVFYRFDDENSMLVYGQKIVMDEKDIRDGAPGNFDLDKEKDYLEKGWDINVVQSISKLSFTYAANEDELKKDDPGDWTDNWSIRNRVPPAISMTIGFADDRSENRDEGPAGETRVFYPGYFGAV